MLNKLKCLLFGHIWEQKGKDIVCKRCGVKK